MSKKNKITEQERKEIQGLKESVDDINSRIEQAKQMLLMKQGAYNYVMKKIVDKYDVDTDTQTLDLQTGEIIDNV